MLYHYQMKQHNNEYTELNSKYIIERVESNTISFTANTVTYVSIDAAKFGYIPVGIVGITNGSSTDIQTCIFSIKKSVQKAEIGLISPVARSTYVGIDVLYMKL